MKRDSLCHSKTKNKRKRKRSKSSRSNSVERNCNGRQKLKFTPRKSRMGKKSPIGILKRRPNI
jgi:hypothetical protein